MGQTKPLCLIGWAEESNLRFYASSSSGLGLMVASLILGGLDGLEYSLLSHFA